MNGPAAAPPTGDVGCPRCGGRFHCGAADPAPCACAGLSLPAALLQELRGRYSGCLCPACLRELAAAAADPRCAC